MDVFIGLMITVLVFLVGWNVGKIFGMVINATLFIFTDGRFGTLRERRIRW